MGLKIHRNLAKFAVDPNQITPLLWNLRFPVDNFSAAVFMGRVLGFCITARRLLLWFSSAVAG